MLNTLCATYTRKPTTKMKQKGTTATMHLREETQEDFEAVLDFVEGVFKQTDISDGRIERALISEIRESKYYVPKLTQILEDDNGTIVGYYMFSKFPIGGKFEDRVLLLAPIAISTARQKQGLGTMMMKHGIELAKKLGYAGIVLVGHADYYPRFGFKESTVYKIAAQEGVPAENQMALELREGALNGIEGVADFSIYRCLAQMQ